MAKGGWDPRMVSQGMRRQAQLEEQEGDSFTTRNSVTEADPKAFSGSKNRMAGQVMFRQRELMENPDESQRTMNWMNMFGASNDGVAWNQARMGMMGPPPEQGAK